ncbi:hypothetical protein [Priestia koreensis]|uniref:Lipoprotein n=1 Tax=Priestia koreensis TaxID=284581 RepID=A0A0M0KWE9_9BACI|nr:hypothetical protein [Priestia koreensis]KOO42713.1 hypothetical protein AMD01_16330 [Priestia koreensis]MCM3005543.1 hypothetical protein [Priestia koreensis]
MKKVSVLFITFFAVFLMSGCNNQPTIKSEEKLVIEQLTKTEGQYEQINEITDKKEIKKVLAFFKKAEWISASDKSTYPKIKMNDYYGLWVMSDNALKVRIDSLNQNTVLSKKDSNELYQLIIGEKLSE